MIERIPRWGTAVATDLAGASGRRNAGAGGLLVAASPFHTADVGTGTGILAIRAAQLGLGPVEAFDTEAESVRVARENADANDVAGQIVVREGTLPPRGAGPYGLVLANIFLTALEELLPRLDRRLARGGSLLIAGITDSQEDRMREGLAGRGLQVVDRICETAQRGARRWPVLLVRKP
jgi:ribosomal protein L11 methyltransferase